MKNPPPARQRSAGVIVAPGKTIYMGEGKALKPRTVLRVGLHGITDENIDAWLRDGTAIEVNVGEEISDAEARTRPRGPAVPSREVDERGNLLAPPTPRKGAAPGRSEGKWSYDPNSLRGLSLAKLNALVAGIDSNLPPFRTQEEAIAQLSHDFPGNETQARVS